MVNLRKASIKDAREISDICKMFTTSRENNRKEGFIEYPKISLDEWVSRIRNNQFFYVIEEANDVVGFSSAYTKEQLDSPSFLNDEIVQKILSKKDNFVYWDQLAILPKFQNHGYVKDLSNAFLNEVEKSEYKSIYGPIIHNPHKNETSIRLTVSLGFQLSEEIEVYSGLIFGVYKKDL